MGVCPLISTAHSHAENPVADAGDYRLELLVSARSLRVLDDIPFEQDELQEAAEVGSVCGCFCFCSFLRPTSVFVCIQLRKSRK